MDKYAAVISMMAWWSLLALAGLALLSAWVSSDSALRRGTAVLSLGVLLLGGWVMLWYLWLTGEFSAFKEPVLPLDFIRPGTLVFIGGLIGLAGVWLLLQGIRLLPVRVSNPVGAVSTDIRYGKVARFLHWFIGLGIVALTVIGVFMAGLRDDHDARLPLILLHKSIGLALLVLAVVRLWWMSRDPHPPIAKSLSVPQRLLAKSVHYALLVFIVAFPMSGWLMSNTADKTTLFLWWEMPPLLAPDQELVQVFGFSHKLILPMLLYLLLAAHLLGVIKHHFVDRDAAAIRRMAL